MKLTYFGTVRSYADRCGYGFITDDDSQRSLFFHASQLPRGIVPPIGARVRYRICDSERGPQAWCVEVLPWGAPSRRPAAPGRDGASAQG